MSAAKGKNENGGIGICVGALHQSAITIKQMADEIGVKLHYVSVSFGPNQVMFTVQFGHGREMSTSADKKKTSSPTAFKWPKSIQLHLPSIRFRLMLFPFGSVVC